MGGFLQTNAASAIKELSITMDMSAVDREMLASFLSNKAGYAPAGGEIVGILKTMHDEKNAEMVNDLEDTKEDLAESKKFLADLDVNCANKKKEWAAYQKMQGEELLALADTIKVLNDDDALELFKKTLPSA